ncbi:hypothetical protein H0H93_009790 [Arthromyces matolae]|nr:hypothetical protein H0H93_009790 [Arthromyces matolae]
MYMDADSLIILFLLFLHAAAQGVVTVDDSDLSISFTGNWAVIGPGEGVGSTNAPSSVALDSTVHQTQDGAAEAVFSFTGTAISVYGLSNPGGELSMLYSIDGMSPTGQRGATLASDGGPASCLWFSTEGLSAGNHVLTMQMDSTPRSGAYFILDYIMFTKSTTVESSSGISTTDPIAKQRNTSSLSTIVTTSFSQGQSQSAAATADSPVMTPLSIVSLTKTLALDSGVLVLLMVKLPPQTSHHLQNRTGHL